MLWITGTQIISIRVKQVRLNLPALHHHSAPTEVVAYTILSAALQTGWRVPLLSQCRCKVKVIGFQHSIWQELQCCASILVPDPNEGPVMNNI